MMRRRRLYVMRKFDAAGAIARVWGCFLLFLLFGAGANGATLEGECVAVSDGDTVTVYDAVRGEREKVRIWGIDAPEGAQEYGSEARAKLSELVRGKRVRVEYDGRDKYHRILGRVYVGGVYVNLEMVKVGYAWHYVYFAPAAEEFRRAEAAARAARRGLWAGAAPQAPWDFRHSGRGRGKLSVPDGTEQYWVSSTGKVHRSGCKYYGMGDGHMESNPSGSNCKICGGKR